MAPSLTAPDPPTGKPTVTINPNAEEANTHSVASHPVASPMSLSCTIGGWVFENKQQQPQPQRSPSIAYTESVISPFTSCATFCGATPKTCTETEVPMLTLEEAASTFEKGAGNARRTAAPVSAAAVPPVPCVNYFAGAQVTHSFSASVIADGALAVTLNVPAACEEKGLDNQEDTPPVRGRNPLEDRSSSAAAAAAAAAAAKDPATELLLGHPLLRCHSHRGLVRGVMLRWAAVSESSAREAMPACGCRDHSCGLLRVALCFVVVASVAALFGSVAFYVVGGGGDGSLVLMAASGCVPLLCLLYWSELDRQCWAWVREKKKVGGARTALAVHFDALDASRRDSEGTRSSKGGGGDGTSGGGVRPSAYLLATFVLVAMCDEMTRFRCGGFEVVLALHVVASLLYTTPPWAADAAYLLAAVYAVATAVQEQAGWYLPLSVEAAADSSGAVWGRLGARLAALHLLTLCAGAAWCRAGCLCTRASALHLLTEAEKRASADAKAAAAAATAAAEVATTAAAAATASAAADMAARHEDSKGAEAVCGSLHSEMSSLSAASRLSRPRSPSGDGTVRRSPRPEQRGLTRYGTERQSGVFLSRCQSRREQPQSDLSPAHRVVTRLCSVLLFTCADDTPGLALQLADDVHELALSKEATVMERGLGTLLVGWGASEQQATSAACQHALGMAVAAKAIACSIGLHTWSVCVARDRVSSGQSRAGEVVYAGAAIDQVRQLALLAESIECPTLVTQPVKEGLADKEHEPLLQPVDLVQLDTAGGGSDHSTSKVYTLVTNDKATRATADVYAQAFAALRSGAFERAVVLFDQCLTLSPDDAQARRLRVLTAMLHAAACPRVYRKQFTGWDVAPTDSSTTSLPRTSVDELTIVAAINEAKEAHMLSLECSSECSSEASECCMLLDSTGTVQWRSEKILGHGAHGAVWLGLGGDGTFTALKFYEVPMSLTAPVSSVLTPLIREIAILSSLAHPNVVSYKGYAVTATSLVLCLECVCGGSLHDLLRQFGSLNLQIVIQYTRDVVAGLSYLHRHGVAHRDLKPANVLIQSDGRCKLTDFGTAAQMAMQMEATILMTSNRSKSGRSADLEEDAPKQEVCQGTPAYMAPEASRGRSGLHSDVWSLGISVFQMWTGALPYAPEELELPMHLTVKVSRAEVVPDLSAVQVPDMLFFLQRCLVFDSAKRATSAELVTIPFCS